MAGIMPVGSVPGSDFDSEVASDGGSPFSLIRTPTWHWQASRASQRESDCQWQLSYITIMNHDRTSASGAGQPTLRQVVSESRCAAVTSRRGLVTVTVTVPGRRRDSAGCQ